MMTASNQAWALPFIPEALTPLSFTPSWRRLNDTERLRYNQLHGLYFHEQIIFFEQAIIVPLMRSLQPSVTDLGLRAALDVFIDEENRHSRQFHDMLRSLRPDWYGGDWRHFVRIGSTGETLLAAMLRHPRRFPFFIWLVQLLEERTMFASRLYLATPDAFPAEIIATQRQHLVDEADHVQWDLALLEQFWHDTPSWLRRLNIRLLNWMLGEFIAVPRRAALRVIDALASDLPTLSVPADTLKHELRALAGNRDFRGAVFGRDAVPRTWKHARCAPDMHLLINQWLSYEHTALSTARD
jgi:hypothetical protein